MSTVIDPWIDCNSPVVNLQARSHFSFQQSINRSHLRFASAEVCALLALCILCYALTPRFAGIAYLKDGKTDNWHALRRGRRHLSAHMHGDPHHHSPTNFPKFGRRHRHSKWKISGHYALFPCHHAGAAATAGRRRSNHWEC